MFKRSLVASQYCVADAGSTCSPFIAALQIQTCSTSGEQQVTENALAAAAAAELLALNLPFDKIKTSALPNTSSNSCLTGGTLSQATGQLGRHLLDSPGHGLVWSEWSEPEPLIDALVHESIAWESHAAGFKAASDPDKMLVSEQDEAGMLRSVQQLDRSDLKEDGLLIGRQLRQYLIPQYNPGLLGEAQRLQRVAQRVEAIVAAAPPSLDFVYGSQPSQPLLPVDGTPIPSFGSAFAAQGPQLSASGPAMAVTPAAALPHNHPFSAAASPSAPPSALSAFSVPLC